MAFSVIEVLFIFFCCLLLLFAVFVFIITALLGFAKAVSVESELFLHIIPFGTKLIFGRKKKVYWRVFTCTSDIFPPDLPSYLSSQLMN